MVVYKNEGCAFEEEKMEQVVCFKHLGATLHESGQIDERKLSQSDRRGENWMGLRKGIQRNKYIVYGAMKGICEAIFVSTILDGSETWLKNAENISRVETVEMRCLFRVTKYDSQERENLVDDRAKFSWDWMKGQNRSL